METASVDTTRVHRARLLAAGVLLTLGFAALSARLWIIQIVEHEEHLETALRLRRATEPILAYNGTVRLKDKVIVARDVVDNEIGLDPRYLSSDKIQQVVRLVCEAMNKSPEYRRERLLSAVKQKESGASYVHVAGGVSDATVEDLRSVLSRILSRAEQRSFRVEPKPRRAYPRGTLASVVVGVVDAGGKGIEGIERSMRPYLDGADGKRVVIRDATQKTRMFTMGNAEVPAVGGHDVHLTIDSRLQAIVESELDLGIQRNKAEAGLFILMDCNSGDILAMASRPTYDPNRFSEYPEAERKKRRSNRAVESLVEPGSVIKPFLLAAALDRGLCRREQLVRDLVTSPVSWDGGKRARFGRRTVTDVHEYPDLTMEGALVHSSNISMAILGLRMGRTGIVDMLDRFGLCRATGIDLPAEADGKYTSPEKWSPVYTSVSVSFGYEVMLSPLQLCRGFASLVNGGYLLRPRVVDKIVRDGEERVFPSRQVVSRPITEETSRTMRQLLRLVVEEGTGKWLKIQGFEFGGKTGTADMAHGGYAKKDYLASFEAFAPYEDPQVVALCMIEKPRADSYYGAMVAGPVVAEVLRRVFRVEAETKLAMLRKRAAP